MQNAKGTLNPAAIAIENAQSDIRVLIKNSYLYRYSRIRVERELKAIIDKTLKEIEIPRLKRDTRVSLINFANQQRIIWQQSEFIPEVLLFLSHKPTSYPPPRLSNAIETISGFNPKTIAKGVPLQRYYADIWKSKVKPTLDNLVKVKALDPNDYTGRNSLRNLAEMEVRYKAHIDEIADLKAQGVKIVACSSHADCSDRCAPWQGRLYSLDGSTGKINGISYVPLEKATDHYYTTKAGRVYKNGLLGFNCFDDKTELYTSEGWKPFKDLKGNELIYTLNPETRQTEWQKAINYYQARYDGVMIKFYNYTTNVVVTPNHNMLFFTQKNKKLRFSQAELLPKSVKFYAGEQYEGKEVDKIKIGGKLISGDLYCKFIAYYLSDGSAHTKSSIKIAQTNNEDMCNELSKLPFKVWRDSEKIVIHSSELAEEMREYGKCDNKYLPEELFKMSKRQIKIFLNAYLHTDGYISKQHKIKGFTKPPHLSVFTTSKKLADGLSELALKAGYRPKIEIRIPRDVALQFPNGKYKSKLPLYVIHFNRNVNVGHLRREDIDYHGNIYCVEVPNHTVLIKRKGQILWCGNCRHYLREYTGQLLPAMSAKERKQEYKITQTQRRLESEVRKAKAEALMSKNLNRAEYLKARKRAAVLYKQYVEYCNNNNRAAYPMRTDI